MKYFKHSMYQGRKGDAWSYFECDDAGKPVRQVTYFAQAKRIEHRQGGEKVTLPPLEKLHPSSQSEFQTWWDTHEVT